LASISVSLAAGGSAELAFSCTLEVCQHDQQRVSDIRSPFYSFPAMSSSGALPAGYSRTKLSNMVSGYFNHDLFFSEASLSASLLSSLDKEDSDEVYEPWLARH